MANSVPDFNRPRCHLTLHPAEDARVADLHSHQEYGNVLDGPAEGIIHAMGKPEAGADHALRSYGWTGCGLVRRAVLRFVLSAEHPESEPEDSQHHHCDRSADLSSLFH